MPPDPSRARSANSPIARGSLAASGSIHAPMRPRSQAPWYPASTQRLPVLPARRHVLAGNTGNDYRYWPGSLSRAMFSVSTSTRGSPRKPRLRPWVYLLTSDLTSGTCRCLAAATRVTWIAAYAGEMSGSRPDPEAVTASGEIAEIATWSNAAICSWRCLTVVSRVELFAPRLDAPEYPGSQP